jgi:nitroimidazol reductase NimA-like FMN-containing flavoprotein (pyridoxamine 5'-phosphate oxidase superfamily)
MVAALDIGTDPQVVEFDRTQCVDLLGTVRVARVVLSVGCIPFALPVNMTVHDGDVIFATDGGSKVTSSVYGQVVSVEADEIDLASHRGWSILVTGIAQRVTRPAELDCASPLLQAWVSEPQPMLVKVPSTLISGRWLLWGDR